MQEDSNSSVSRVLTYKGPAGTAAVPTTTTSTEKTVTSLQLPSHRTQTTTIAQAARFSYPTPSSTDPAHDLGTLTPTRECCLLQYRYSSSASSRTPVQTAEMLDRHASLRATSIQLLTGDSKPSTQVQHLVILIQTSAAPQTRDLRRPPS